MQDLASVVLILLFAAAAGLAIYAFVMGPIQRRRTMAEVAGELGLSFSRDDPFGMLGLPFPLFRKGDGRRIENVMWGERDGIQVWAFDYWYYERSTDSNGHTHKRTYRFSCGLTEPSLRAPHTTIGPETLLTRMANLVGFRDIDFESDEFNRRMRVKSQDRRFATYLIDPRMMEWLLETRGWSFELHGRHLLCVRSRLKPALYPSIIEAVVGFRQQMPKVVYETYGG